MPSFSYQLPDGERAVHELTKRLTSIGRGRENDLTLAGRNIEDTHVVVRFNGDSFSVQSVCSTGFTFGGRHVDSATLSHGDEITIGDQRLIFRLFDADSPSPSAPSSAAETTYRQMLEMSRKLLTHHEPDALLADLMDGIIELTRADKGFLLLVENGALNVRVARNIGDTANDSYDELYSDSIVAQVVRERQPLIVADALHDQQFSSSKSVVNYKICSVMCAPLMVADSLLGLIYVANDNVVNLFTDAHLEVLTIFAAQASLILSAALTINALQDDNQALRETVQGIRFGSLVGSCDAMRAVYRRVEKVAATDVSVLITGETGTGKELIAREIHSRSDRAKGPFVTINCGAIPENLLESELFGHARGAFTGAVAARAGRFQAADKGTLFLDEIGEMPVNLQVKILRAIQERTVTRVGETRPERVDIRIVAATHRDLPEMIRAGEFREDLYYRLNVVAIALPALRERDEDVVVIAQYLLDRFVEEFSAGARQFAPDALAAIRRHPWPGNIRQLENHIKKAVILAEGASIRAADLDLAQVAAAEIKPLADAREEWQRRYILDALALNDGNRTKTARDLGVDPRTVFRFLEKENEKENEEP